MANTYKEVKAYIDEVVNLVNLPVRVKGSLIKIPINEKGIHLIKLANIEALDGSQVRIDESRTINSVFLDVGPIVDIDEKYGKFYNEEIYAEVILNDKRSEQYDALEKNEVERLFKIDDKSLDTIIHIDNLVVEIDENGYLIKESFYTKVLSDIKNDLGIADYVLSRDDLISELAKIEFATQEVENKNNRLAEEVLKKEKESEELINLTTEMSDELKNLKTQASEQKQQHNEDIRLFNEQLAYLRKYRLIKDDVLNDNASHENLEELLTFSDFSNYSDLIDYVHGYILAKNIYYKRETILEFFALVRTHDFVVLAGQSGVGKTSLVKEFANAVNARVCIIPVKPNWMSKEDLLGYYNPIQKQYISTEFLDVLIEAQNNPNKPYFICLDEMNLARVEYYFADFLSKLENREHSIEIQLYPESLYPDLNKITEILRDISPKLVTPQNIMTHQDLIDFISDLYQLSDLSPESSYKYFQQLIPCISPSVTIGDNVHFFGTANIDETTHYFSEKILDRVHVLKFDNALDIDISLLDESLDRYKNRKAPFDSFLNKKINLTIDHLGRRVEYPAPSLNEELRDNIIEIYKEFLKILNIQIGWRVVRQIIFYGEQIQLLTTTNEEPYLITINGFIKHKIFPRVSINNKTEKEVLSSLLNYLSVMGLENYSSYITLNEMIEILEKEDGKRLNYWDL